MKKIAPILLASGLIFLLAACGRGEGGPKAPAAPQGVARIGIVTLVDLGSTHCRPCIMMMPVLASLNKKYAGRVEVKFIDVDEQPGIAKRLQIMTIPTQIIYDREGNEVIRHIGFFPEDGLAAELDRVLAGK